MRMLQAENMNFRLNIRTANFCDSGRLFALSQMPSLQNLKEFLWGPPPPPYTQYFLPGTPFEGISLACPPSNSNSPHPLPPT